MKKFPKTIVLILVGLLHLVSFSASAQTTAGVYNVTVNTPGTFGQVMLQAVDNWSDVVELTVNGSLNSADMAYFSRMLNMTKLDVSQTDITVITGCNGLSALQTVILPESVIRIDDNAFNSCTKLSSINLDNIEEIGHNAFNSCTGLTGTISGPRVKYIGNQAFYYCYNIGSISFPVIEEIGANAFKNNYNRENKLATAEISKVKLLGDYAFQNCKLLKAIDISNCEEIGSYCFSYCRNLANISLSDNLKTITSNCFEYTGIKSIKLPSNLKSIDYGAFAHATISELNLPESLESIGSYSFEGCPLTSISLPSTLQYIDSDAFFDSYPSSTSSYSLSDVYCATVTPLNTSAFNNDFVKNATLHVPAFSVSAYKLDDNWYKFNKIEALDGDLTDVTINNNFTIIDYTGLADNANLTLTSKPSTEYEQEYSAGHLSISAGTPLSLGNFIQYQNTTYTYHYYPDADGNPVRVYDYPYLTTVIPDNEVRANSVTTKISLPTNKWSFISMPYDVNVSSIRVPAGTMWVIRKYNGSNRAAMTGDTWENVTEGQILNAGEGYILHCVKENGNEWDSEMVEFEFPAINNGNKNNLFAYDDVVKTLDEYPAEFSHNRGWNLIGNPFPSFFNSHYIDFYTPVTVWNGNGYTAYSLTDDEYVFRPNESFFVQCPVNTNQVTFRKEGRTHSYTTTPASSSRSRSISATDRAILNFAISDGNYSDRTRLVINEEASSEYEIEKDASKFMSSNAEVPQIYILDNGISYAIDERPLGTGEYALGVRTGKDGDYKITLNALNPDYDVTLIDKETARTVDLTRGEYSFTSAAQTSTNRFSVRIASRGTESSIENIEAATPGYTINGNQLMVEGNTAVSIISIDGRTIYSGIVDGSVELHSGIYLLSIGNSTHKIAIK